MDNFDTDDSFATSSDNAEQFFKSFAHPTKPSQSSQEIKEKKSERETKDETSEHIQETALALMKPVAGEETFKKLHFGDQVETVRRDIMYRRQMCKTKADFDQLYKTIDGWMGQANAKQEKEIEIRLLLDKSIVAHFGFDFKTALKLSDDALDKMKDIVTPDTKFQLELVGKFVQVSIYSRDGQYGKAWGILQQIATDIQKSTNSVDHWRLHYNMGTNYLARLKASNFKNDRICDPGIQHFTQSRDAIVKGEDNGQTYEIQDHFFGLVMCAKILLDLPEHKVKRERKDLPKDRIMKAQSFLQLICSDYPFFKMVLRFQLRLLITLASLYYRRGQFYKRNRENNENYESEAKRSFMDAMLFLEGASMLAKESPYEETQIIEEFIKYLHDKTESSLFHKDLDIKAGMYTFTVYKSSSDERGEWHEAGESEGFTSDNFGNPTRHKATANMRKRLTKKAASRRREPTTGSDQSLTTSTSLSSGLLRVEPYASHHFYALEDASLFCLITEAEFTVSSLSSSANSDNLESSISSSDSSSQLFRLQRDKLPEDVYPGHEVPLMDDYEVPDETPSTDDDIPALYSTESEAGIPMDNNKEQEQRNEKVENKYHFLTHMSMDENGFAIRQHQDATLVEYRKSLLFEIRYVQDFVCSSRKLGRSRESICVPLLISAKCALDFPETEIGKLRFVVDLADLISANDAIKVIKEIIPIYACAQLKTEVLLLLASYYFRSAQMGAKLKRVSTCKFCINMAQLYAGFAVAFAQEGGLRNKMVKLNEFQSYVTKAAERCDKKNDYTLLLPENGA